MSAGGKGHAPRPFSVGKDEYAANWDRIFGKKPQPQAPAPAPAPEPADEPPQRDSANDK